MIRHRSLISISNSILPSQYQQVDFIQSTGTQYINTGVNCSNDLGIYFDGATNNAINSSNVYIPFGYYQAQTNYFQLTVYYYQSKYGYISFNSGSGENALNANMATNRRQQWSLLNSDWNTTGVSQSSVATRPTGTIPIYLFARNANGNADAYSSTTVYSFKMYRGSILIRDFIPCYRISDNVAGLYDLVTKQFYTNSGTGAFLVGEDIYSYGNEETDITGGWSTYTVSGYTAPTLTKNTDNLYLYGSGSDKVGGFYAVNKIDFTNYSKLKVKATTSYGSSQYTRLNVVLTDTLPTSANPENSIITNVVLTQGTNVITELNIA